MNIDQIADKIADMMIGEIEIRNDNHAGEIGIDAEHVRVEVSRILRDELPSIGEFFAMDSEITRLRRACDIYRAASIQSHNGHWDPQQTHGANCPECIRSRKEREKADALLEATP